MIQEFNNEFIVIAEDSTNTDLITDLSTIDCFYHVYGERKDINPLIVEYEATVGKIIQIQIIIQIRLTLIRRIQKILDLSAHKHNTFKKLVYIEKRILYL